MAYTAQYDNYIIDSEAGSLLPPEQFKYHQHHYKDGKVEFEKWIKTQARHTLEVRFNYFATLAQKIIANGGILPDKPLYDLQRWLKGRQVCYYHHLVKGDADDAHLRPIEVAMDLIDVFQPQQSKDIIDRCTPLNLRDLVQVQGSAKAQKMYARLQPQPAVSRNDYCSDSDSSLFERERKHNRMSQCSWRQPLDSTDSDSSSGRSTRSSFSSFTSISSLESSRSRSTSPEPSATTEETPRTHASGAASPSWRHTVEEPKTAASSTSGSKKLVLMTSAARRRSISPRS